MRLLILYGSQTGTAQDFAEHIWRESKRLGFNGPVLAMDDYAIQNLITEELAVFVVSTTGNGEEPDNMRETWKFLLRRSLVAHSLDKMQFGVLGLGDSSYDKFNYAAKRLNKRLLQLGATNLMPIGLCDDQHSHGANGVALRWIKKLKDQLKKKINGQETELIRNPADFIFKYSLKVLEDADRLAELDELRWPYLLKPEVFVLKSNERTTQESHFQDVRLLSFQFGPHIYWDPGDVIQVRPQNSEAQIAKFFALVKEHNLDFSAETIVQICSNFEDLPLPLQYRRPVTIGQLVRYVWDLNALPRQLAFELLAINCDDEMEKEKLLEFTTSEGLDELIDYINRPRRTILEVLQDFRNATSKLTLQILFELFQSIQARSFSIASVPASGTLDLLVAVVKYKTRMSTPRIGLCSNWLKKLKPGAKILGCTRMGTMKLTQNLKVPLIMVGPGTGIAPFRSILQQKALQKEDGLPVGKIIVFFGCRNKSLDFHFAKDLNTWHKNHVIKLYVAASREQDYKIYVQHLIAEQSEKIRDLIMNQEAMVLVAGSSKNMPKEVRMAIAQALGSKYKYVEQMVKSGRYQEETWS